MDTLFDFSKIDDGWQLLGIIFALGAVVMALLQLLNDLTPVRWVFHDVGLRRWIAERIHLYEETKGSDSPLPDADPDEAFALLVSHATGGNSRALLGLPTPQLVAQINAAAQAVLEDPEAYFSLLATLSQPALPKLRRAIIPGVIPAKPDDHLNDLYKLIGIPTDEPAEKLAAKDRLEARNRIAHRIQRNLDAIQIILTNSATLANQILAILISIALAYLAAKKTVSDTSAQPYVALVIGIAAGYIAPLLGDVVAAIRKLGRR